MIMTRIYLKIYFTEELQTSASFNFIEFRIKYLYRQNGY